MRVGGRRDPAAADARVRRGKLGPGEPLAVDAAGRGVGFDKDVKRTLAARRPYLRWLAVGRLEPPRASRCFRLATFARAAVLAGYTREDLTLVLRPAASNGHEPISSMGDDSALPPLAGRARPLYTFFRQRFAQVTNPPIDHLRERSVMSLQTLWPTRRCRGRPLWREATEPRELLSPSTRQHFPLLRAKPSSTRRSATRPRNRLQQAVLRCCCGCPRRWACLLLDDAATAEGRLPLPALLAVAAVHSALVEEGVRTTTSLFVVASDEPREAHHFACLIGYGADAVRPRLALETVADLGAAGQARRWRAGRWTAELPPCGRAACSR